MSDLLSRMGSCNAEPLADLVGRIRSRARGLRPGGSAQGAERGRACRRDVGGPSEHRRPPPSNPPAAKDKAAAQPASPASLEEATRVIDLRKFPIPDGGKDLYKSAAVPKGDRGKDLIKSARALFYVLRRSGGAEVAQFCRTKLAEAGWKLTDAPASKDYFEFTGFKQGFFLSGSVYENRAAGTLGVTITNHGNIDSRTLPRFAGAELKDNSVLRTIYLTDAKPDAVIEFMRAELKKGGWREVRDQTGEIDMEPGFPVILRFIQRGIEIDLSVQAKKGKTEVWNKVHLLDVELPIMPEAKGNVQFLGYSHYVHLFYAVPTRDRKKFWNSTARSCPTWAGRCAPARTRSKTGKPK